MPSIFTHAAVPLVLRALAGPRIFHGRMLGAGLALSIVPDADVAAFALGIPYDAAAGHRERIKASRAPVSGLGHAGQCG